MGGQWGKPHHKKGEGGGLEGGMPILKFANIPPLQNCLWRFIPFYAHLWVQVLLYGQVLQYLCSKTVKSTTTHSYWNFCIQWNLLKTIFGEFAQQNMYSIIIWIGNKNIKKKIIWMRYILFRNITYNWFCYVVFNSRLFNLQVNFSAKMPFGRLEPQ
jgi:hypothetical protein